MTIRTPPEWGIVFVAILLTIGHLAEVAIKALTA